MPVACWLQTKMSGFTPVLPTRTAVRVGLASGLPGFHVPVSSKPYVPSIPGPRERRPLLSTPKRLIATDLAFDQPGEVRITIVPPDVTPAGAAQSDIKPVAGNFSHVLGIGSFLMVWLVVGLLWEAARGERHSQWPRAGAASRASCHT